MQVPLENITSVGNVRVQDLDVDTLAESIDRTGLIQPVVLLEQEDGNHVLLAGHRRVAAARKLGWATIPAVFNETVETPTDRIVAQYHENVERDDLSAWETAQATFELKALGVNQKQIAEDLVMTVQDVSDNQKAARAFGAVSGEAQVALNELSEDGLFDLADEAEHAGFDTVTIESVLTELVGGGGHVSSVMWQAAREKKKREARERLEPLLAKLTEMGGVVVESQQELDRGAEIIAVHSAKDNGDDRSGAYNNQLGFNEEQVAKHRALNECHAYLLVEGYDGLVLREYCLKPKWHTEGGKSTLKELNAGGKAKTREEQKAERKAVREAKKQRIARVKELVGGSGKWNRKHLIEEVLPIVFTLYADDMRAVAKALELDTSKSTSYRLVPTTTSGVGRWRCGKSSCRRRSSRWPRSSLVLRRSTSSRTVAGARSMT